MTPRKILITGMGRTASTVLYNAIRLTLLEHGSTYAAVDMLYNPYNPAHYHLVKAHQYKGWDHLAGWADIVFTFRRDLRDVVASYKRKHEAFKKRLPDGKLWEPDHMHLGDVNVEWYKAWAAHSNHEWVYEDYMANPRPYIEEYVGHLGLEVTGTTHEYVFDLPTFEAGEPDPDSLVGPEHITDGRVGSYIETLTPKERSAIEDNHGGWLKEMGYL